MTKLYRIDGYNESDLFDTSNEHLMAAETLFCTQEVDKYLKTMFSAGYLCHLGIELLLKGCCLRDNNYFEDTHNLLRITKNISCLEFDADLQRIMKKIDVFYLLRYSMKLGNIEKKLKTSNSSEGIGDQDWIDTITFLHKTIEKMPKDLADIANPIFSYFENALIEEKFLKEGKYYYNGFIIPPKFSLS